MFLLIKLYQNLFLWLLPSLSLLLEICDYLFTYSGIDLVGKVFFGGNMDKGAWTQHLSVLVFLSY